ncbi:MAG TPA: hypothetical protein VML50_11005 [Anaeromyxobacter sp.]|nr:hypothetical protein [Anaeromyxobacter sp.]
MAREREAAAPPPRPRRSLFDAYLMVDWSAASGPTGRVPRHDAVWVAEARWGGRALRFEAERYFPTRRACVEHLAARLEAHLSRGRTVLAGFDFPFGFPAGLARALGLRAPGWRAIWRLLRSPASHLPGAPENRYAAADNRNNRFAVAAAVNRAAQGGERGRAGPFFGCPRREETAWLGQARPTFPVAAARGARLSCWRSTDEALRRAGLSPLSPWWVLGGGAPTVGGQALVGIPAVAELAERLDGRARIWPLETGFAPPPSGAARAVLAEIWPGLVNDRLEQGLVRDAAQVRAMARWAAGADADGTLRRLLAAPPGLGGADLAACLSEEGWTLGAGPGPRPGTGRGGSATRGRRGSGRAASRPRRRRPARPPPPPARPRPPARSRGG